MKKGYAAQIRAMKEGQTVIFLVKNTASFMRSLAGMMLRKQIGPVSYKKTIAIINEQAFTGVAVTLKEV